MLLLQVDVMMLDLDVGFIDSPMHLVRGIGSSKSDVFVQVRYALYCAYYVEYIYCMVYILILHTVCIEYVYCLVL